MEPNFLKIFNNDLMQSVSAFCSANNINDVEGFIKQCFKQGFDIKKYGLLGNSLNDGEKHLKIDGIEEKWVEKEVIVEKRVEIPVEVIKEVEKIVEVIKEVPVDRIIEKEIIKEVPVEKIVTKIEYISDKQGEDELFGKIEQLEEKIFQLNNELSQERQNFSTKIHEMENNFQDEKNKLESDLKLEKQNIKITEDNSKIKMIQETLVKLRSELKEKNDRILELEKINKELETRNNPTGAVYMKGSNISENI